MRRGGLSSRRVHRWQSFAPSGLFVRLQRSLRCHGTRLYGNKKWLYSLQRAIAPEQRALLDSSGVCNVSYKNGKKQITGGPKLKLTQSYTPEFGKAVASAILDTAEEDGKVGADVLSSFLDEEDLGVAPEWHDLHLEPVWDFMRKLA